MVEEATKEKPDLGPFTAEERAHFDSRGEKDIPVPQSVTEAPAQAPVPGATDAPVPTAEPARPDKPDKPEHVPIATLQEERRRRQEAEERARQTELLNVRMEERFRAFRDALAPRQQAPQAPPSADQDIFGAVRHMQAEQTRTRAEIDAYKRQIQAEDQIKQLQDWGRNAEAEYVRANPDYYQALNHLRAARVRDLQVLGMSPSAINQQLLNEENQLLARAAAERRNPAHWAHELAKARGYTRAAAPAAQRSDGTLPPSNVDLNRIEAGQRQSASLSNVGGGAGRDLGDIEIEDLLKMNDREFGAFIEKYPGRFRRLKGAAH